MLSTHRLGLLAFLLVIQFINPINAQDCQNNILSNPGFENGTSGWSITGDVSISPDALNGNSALEIAADGNRIYQTLSASPGQIFTLNASWKKLAANGDGSLGIKFLTGTSNPIEFHLRNLEEVSDYVEIETIVATAPAQTAFIEITALSNAASSAIRVDDFCLTVEGSGSGQKADLAIANIRADGQVDAGGPLDVTFDLTNNGEITAFGDLKVGLYLSTDQQLSSDDLKLGSETYSNIPVGGTADLTALLTIPFNTPDGDYYLIVNADDESQINEEDENNNASSKFLEIGLGGPNPIPCEIEVTILNNSITCNDNGTPDDESDDRWSFEVQVINTLNNDAIGWKAEANGLNFSGEYEDLFTMSGFNIADGPLDILFRDSADDNCRNEVFDLQPPATCSNGTPPPPCDLDLTLVSGSISCDDNNTPDDESDDTWSFAFRAENNGNPSSSGWRATIDGIALTGDWNETEVVSGLEIANGSIDLRLEDLDNADCNELLNINPPGTCSNGTPPPPCDLDLTLVSGSISCDDNNTPDDESDDTWSFAFRAENNGNPSSSGWRATIDGIALTGDWNETEVVSGLEISNGSIDLRLEDLDNADCNEFLNINPPGTCSNGTPPPPCDIDLTLVSGSISCDDNNTPDDESDDTWSFAFRAENNGNPSSSGWRATGNGIALTGDWNETEVVSGLEIANGSIDLRLEDLDNADCNEFLNINPPGTCSNGTPPPPSSCLDNLLDNGDFEDGLNAWVNLGVVEPTTDAFSGNGAIQIAGDGNRIQQTMDAVPGDVYTLDAVGKNVGSGNNGMIGIKFLSATYEPLFTNYVEVEGTDFYPIPTINETAPTDAAYLEVTAFSQAAGAVLIIDDFCLGVENGTPPPNNDKPDLVIQELSLPMNLEPGGQYNLTYRIGNIGPVATTDEVVVAYYISLDNVISGGDQKIGSEVFGIFGTNEFENKSVDFTVPAALANGSYFLIVKADDENTEEEENESNNTNSSLVNIDDNMGNPPGTPDCDSWSDFPWWDYISKVKINEEGLSSGKSVYSDFTNIVFDVPTEEPNDIELTASFSWANHDEYFTVWIDFNQDRIYGADEIYFQGMLPAKPNGTASNKLRVLDFNIDPTDVVYGLTTMRVIMSRDQNTPPCGSFAFGEVEDYSVNVVEYLTYSPYDTRQNDVPDQLFVYPNPTNSFINVNLEDSFEKSGTLMFVNAMGQIIETKDIEALTEDIYRLSVEGLTSGLYTIYLKVKGEAPKYGKIMVIGEQ